jgi:hypothetical protein
MSRYIAAEQCALELAGRVEVAEVRNHHRGPAPAVPVVCVPSCCRGHTSRSGGGERGPMIVGPGALAARHGTGCGGGGARARRGLQRPRALGAGEQPALPACLCPPAHTTCTAASDSGRRRLGGALCSTFPHRPRRRRWCVRATVFTRRPGRRDAPPYVGHGLRLIEAPCPPYTSHGASIRQPFEHHLAVGGVPDAVGGCGLAACRKGCARASGSCRVP